MRIIVCVKQVPEVADADLELNDEGTDVDREDLVMDINEWDNFAVEEAVRIKESRGGTVTVVTLGDEDAEDVLRRALAMGADEAILIDGEDFEGSDALGIARGLCAAIRELTFDLILTGAQSSDTGWGQVGVTLAELLAIPYATLAVQVDLDGHRATVHRELESNTHEKVELTLPALITVQTGINEPRYISIMGIRKVRGIEIAERDADDLGLDDDQIGVEGSSIASIVLSLPQKGSGAEMLNGSMNEICDRAAQIIKDQGGLS